MATTCTVDRRLKNFTRISAVMVEREELFSMTQSDHRWRCNRLIGSVVLIKWQRFNIEFAVYQKSYLFR